MATPAKGGKGKAKAPVDPIAQQANLQIQASEQPILQQIATERKANLARAQAQMGFSKAAAAIMQAAAPQVSDLYSNAANADAGYARGLGDTAQGTVDQSVAGNNAFLQKMGTPTAGLETAAPIGDINYGLQGYIPATTLQREGAAFGAAAQLAPQNVLNQGQQLAGATLSSDKNLTDLQTELAKIASTEPAVYQGLLKAAQENAYKQAELGQGQQRIAISEQSLQLRQQYENASLSMRQAGLRLQNQKFGFSVQQAIAKGQMPDASLSKVYGYVVDKNGSPVLGPKGQKIKVVSGKGGLPGINGKTGAAYSISSQLGITPNEYFTQLKHAGAIAGDAYSGFKDKSGKVYPPLNWKQALAQEISHGIARPIAIKALRDQGYMPGVRGAPPISPGEGGGSPRGSKGGMGGGNAGGFLPQGMSFQMDRQDQGRDIQTLPGAPIIAPGDGYVVRIGSDPGGGGGHFGPSYPIVHFTSGPYAGQDVYIGHTVSAVRPGQRFTAGSVLSHTQASGPLNGGAPSGWAEIGFAPGGTPGAFGQPVPF